MVDCVIAHADRAGLSILQQLGQGFPALVSGFLNWPVYEVEVEIFQSEPFEAGVTGLYRCLGSLVAVPELGRYEHGFASDAAVAESAANIGLVIVDPRRVDVAVAYLQRVFYCFLGYLSW